VNTYFIRFLDAVWSLILEWVYWFWEMLAMIRLLQIFLRHLGEA